MYEPGQFAAVTAAVVLLSGSESPSGIRRCTDLAAAALPGAEVRVLEGHGHLAHRDDPALVADLLRGLRPGRAGTPAAPVR